MKNRTGNTIIISYISIVFSIVSGLLYTPWLIRTLGSSDYAIYTISTSIMAYFTIDFGIGAAVTRFIARYRAEGCEDRINGLLGVTLKLYLLIDIVAFVALLILSFFLSDVYAGLNPQELDKLKIVYVITCIMITTCIPAMPLNGVFIAYNRVYEVKLFDLAQKFFNIILVCIALLLGEGLFVVTAINAFTTIGVNLIKVVRIFSKEKVYPDIRETDKQLKKSLLAFSSWVAIAMLADKFFFTIEPTLLGAFSDSKQIALFAVAASIEGYVLIFADGLNGIFLPKVTSLVVENRFDKLMSLMIKVGRMQLYIVTFLILGIITQGRDFLILWFGKEYEAAYFVVILVLIPCWIHLTEGIATEALYATNNVKYRTIAYIISAIVNVTITSLLSPKYGAFGAAIGISLGFIIGYEIIMNLVYCKVLKLDIGRFFKSCHRKMVLTVVICGGIGITISSIFPVSRLPLLLIRCILWALLYFIVSWALFLSTSEKETLKDFVSKKIRRYSL